MSMTFDVLNQDTGKLSHPSDVVEEYLLGGPLFPVFAMTQSGRLVTLRPDGTYFYPAVRHKIYYSMEGMS